MIIMFYIEYHKISNEVKYHFNRVLNVRRVNDVRPTAKRTVETLIPVRLNLLRK
jgi:hypothetical protein